MIKKRKLIFIILFILLLISFILILGIVYAINLENHDSSEVLININGYSMTLQEAVDRDFLNENAASPTKNLTTKSGLSGSYHLGEDIFLCIRKNGETIDTTLNNAINFDTGLSSDASCSYSQEIFFGHLAENINIKIDGDTKSLQESINDGDFNCIPDCEEENKECGDDGCGGSCGPCSGCKSCSNGNCVDDDSNCGSNEECSNGECVCIPETCSSLGKECGSHSDGCGRIINCDACPIGITNCDGCGTHEECQDGICVEQLVWWSTTDPVCSDSRNKCPIPRSRLNECSKSFKDYSYCPPSVKGGDRCNNEGESCIICDNFGSQQYVTAYVYRCQYPN